MGKKITDACIMLCMAALAVYVAVYQAPIWWKWLLFILLMAGAIAALNDLIDQFAPRKLAVSMS